MATSDVVVLVGPTVSLLEHEHQGLTAFLAAGGRLLLTVDPDSSFQSDWLKAYGIEIVDEVVIDASLQSQLMGAGAATPLVVGYADHPITAGIEVMSLFPIARPLVFVESEIGYSTLGLAHTSSSSWGETRMVGDTVTFDEEADREGPLTLAAVAWKSTPNGESRIVVVGDSDFASNAYFDRDRSANGKLLLRCLGWLAAP